MNNIKEALTFDDVLLVPQYSEVLPSEACLKSHLTRNIQLNIPLVSAAMDTVTESKLSISMAQNGGIGIIHKNMSPEMQANQIIEVKQYESGIIKHPLTVSPQTTIHEVIELTQQKNISGVPIVEGKKLVGIVTKRDLRFERKPEDPIKNIMTHQDKLITIKENTSKNEISNLFHKHRIEKLLVVDDDFQLKGLITVKDIQKSLEYPHACIDKYEHLRVGAAIGVSKLDYERTERLVEARVDVLVVDTAHGHSKKVLDIIKWIKQKFPEMDVIGGNIATADAAQALINEGIDGLKVGIGPGSICTTRVVSGVGMPQISAIVEVAKVANNIPVISDGGIRFSGDISKALAAGAHTIMLGSLLAGTDESPGNIELYQGRTYKSYRGMGSIAAMAEKYGSSDRYFQDDQNVDKLIPEGVEGRVPYKGAIVDIITQLVGGLRLAMGYVGAKDLATLHKKAKFVRVTTAGYKEGHTHDVMITKEPANYRQQN